MSLQQLLAGGRALILSSRFCTEDAGCNLVPQVCRTFFVLPLSQSTQMLRIDKASLRSQWMRFRVKF